MSSRARCDANSEVGAVARTAQLLSPASSNGDDIGTPVRKLSYAGCDPQDAGETDHGEAGQSLGRTREGHSTAPGNATNKVRAGIGYGIIADNPCPTDRFCFDVLGVACGISGFMADG